MLAQLGADWVGQMPAPVERTHFEDLLMATRFGQWNRITSTYASDEDEGRALANPVDAPNDSTGLAARRSS